MTQPDINFSNDDSHAFLPWVIGVMVGLATLLLCLGLTVDGWIIDRNENYDNRFTVTIPATTSNLDTKMKLIRETLEANKSVTLIDEVSDTRLLSMLESWIGNIESADNLPLPKVLDVTATNGHTVNYKELQSKLTIIAPGTTVSSHERWIASFSQFSSALETLIALLAVLIIVSLGLTIAFTSRASLKLHAKTVGLLHSIGAEDRYISRQFQQDACMLTLYGTVPGCLLAGLAYWGTGFYMASLEASMLPSFSMGGAHLALLVIMPIACASVAWIAARLSVLQQLHHKL
jgi:cell division transport system permease protein